MQFMHRKRTVVLCLMLFALIVSTSAKTNDVTSNQIENINKPSNIYEKIAGQKLKRDATTTQNEADELFKNINNTEPRVDEKSSEAEHEHSNSIKEQDQNSQNSNLYSETTPYDEDAMLLLLETFFEPYTTNLDDNQGEVFPVKSCPVNQIYNIGTDQCEDPPSSPEDDGSDE